MRCLIATLTAPWPSRPQQGRYHLDLALGMKRVGADATIFTPAPLVSPGLARHSAWARRHADRPRRYEIDGVPFVSPAVGFVHPYLVRHRMTRAWPGLVRAWACQTLAPALLRAAQDARADSLLVHGALPWGAPAQHVARKLGIPYGVIEHSWGDVMRLAESASLADAYSKATRGASGAVVVSSPMAEALRTVGCEAPVLHVPNGIDPALRDLGCKPVCTSDGPLRLLSVAAYYRRKGLEELLEALALSARRGVDAHLTVVTRPPDALVQMGKGLGLEGRVTWREPMSRRQLRAEYRAADLFVLPSWNEAFGLVFAESLACGTPVVMSDDCGLAPDLPIDERGRVTCGWVCPARDRAHLSDVLCEAGRDRSRLPRMGEAGRAWALPRFDWNRTAARVLGVLHPRSAQPPLMQSLEAA